MAICLERKKIKMQTPSEDVEHARRAQEYRRLVTLRLTIIV
jgi:hypothetical protein